MVDLILVLNNVYKSILENNTITKMLYYPSTKASDDPLANVNVVKTTAVKYVKKVASDYLIDEINESNPEKRGYITVFTEDFTRMENPYASSVGIRIEIYMPVRKFEEYQWRIQTIVKELNDMFQQKSVTGSLGKLVLDSSFNMNPAIPGYVGYAHVFAAGNMVK